MLHISCVFRLGSREARSFLYDVVVCVNEILEFSFLEAPGVPVRGL